MRCHIHEDASHRLAGQHAGLDGRAQPHGQIRIHFLMDVHAEGLLQQLADPRDPRGASHQAYLRQRLPLEPGLRQ